MVPFLVIQFKSTINKIRANKKSANFAQDVDFDDTIDSFKSRRNRAAAFDESAFDNAGKSTTSIKKSSFKVRNLCI